MLMIIACITMLIDHIGGYILSVPAMRIIGRFAMPIYAYFMAGSFEHTRDRKRYLKKVLCIVVVSQIPYMIMVESVKFNICFTWTISILVLMCIETAKSSWDKNIALIVLLLTGSCIIPMDYGIFAVVWVILFYYRCRIKGIRGNALLIIGAVLNYCIWNIPRQFAGLLAIPVIIICEKYDHVRLKNKCAAKLYRIFYPLHMTIIDICKLI